MNQARFTELATAAALLHDIADAEIPRFDPSHEARSLELATELLSPHGYTEDEIAIVVSDAIRLHSCHDGKVPQTLEGKIERDMHAKVLFNDEKEELMPYYMQLKELYSR